MGKPPSDATVIRTQRQEIARLKTILAASQREVTRLSGCMKSVVAERAAWQRTADEWKGRFDLLLQRMGGGA